MPGRRTTWVFVLCALLAASSAVPVVEIRTGDTDGGPRLELVAVPMLREVTVPDATLFIQEQYVAEPTCAATTETASVDGPGIEHGITPTKPPTGLTLFI